MTQGTRYLRLGRLRFLTTFDDLKEALGDGLETAGATLVAGERKPRPFALTLPVRGHHQDTDPRAEGERLRRQVRALLENGQARLEGLYLAFDIDPDLNGWLLVGGGDLEYDEGRGPTFGDYRLTLTDCYRVGGLRTVRPARRLESADRRLSTTPRDTLGAIYSTDFAAQPAQPMHFFPVGATDLVGDVQPGGSFGTLATTRAAIDGAVPYVTGRAAGEAISILQGAAEHGKADLVALDRRGATAPAYTLAGDADPQNTYGWEELYGPDQPPTPGDAPVLQNGLCRVRYVADRQVFALDAYVAGTGYVEQCRVSALVGFPDGSEFKYGTLRQAGMVEWTPERAVLLVVLGIGGTQDRCEVYLTLQRGWLGPTIEAYATSTGAPGGVLRVVPFTAGAAYWGTSAGGGLIVSGAEHAASFAALEPYAYLIAPAPNRHIGIAVLQGALKAIGRSDTAAYGSARDALSLANIVAPQNGYVSITLSLEAAVAAQALGRRNLIDSRAVPTLVAR